MFNKLVFWIAIGFLIYIIASAKFSLDKERNPAPQQSNVQKEVIQQSPEKKSVMDDAINNLLRPALEGKLPVAISQKFDELTPTEPQNIMDTKLGDGNIAVCGSHVTLRYALEGKTLSEKPEAFTVGERMAPPGVERVVRGMKEKGVRTADLPPALAFNNMALTKSPYTSTKPIPVKIELITSSPEISYKPNAIQIFDKISGTGEAAQCFDTIRVHYSVHTLEGELLVDTETQNLTPLTLSLGKGQAPLGVEEALVGMREGGIRTAILFPEVMKRLEKENQIMLSGEPDYPHAGLIFEFKRIANK